MGTATVIHGNARHLPLANDSVDLICTSPPYFALRSYTDAGVHYEGQIGSEPTPAEFVDALIEVTAECMRVLKPSGSLWVNLGDKYAGGGNGPTGATSLTDGYGERTRQPTTAEKRAAMGTTRPKSLIGIPWRYALRCIDDLGLILRAEVIWSKCLSGGTNVYARVDGREKVMTVKDLARTTPGTAELWTGAKWSPMLRCDPTPPTPGRAASSHAARQARYLGKPVPALAADLEIEFRNGERVGCTPNHKWPTARGIVRADELTIGDVVESGTLPDTPGDSPAGLPDEEVGWFVGMYLAEGSRSEQTIQVACHTREVERNKRLSRIAEMYDGTARVHQTSANGATCNMTGAVLRSILDTYLGGRTAKDKRLAPTCWQRSNRFLDALLRGYLEGDGSYLAASDHWRLGFTANDGLATDLRAMAARLGLSLRLRRAVHKIGEREYPGWRGDLYFDPARRKRPDTEVVAIRQSRAREFWNIEIADEPHAFALASGTRTKNSNGLPESVTDRVRRSHEQWFHFSLNPRYYSAVDEIREAHAEPPRSSYGRDRPVIPGGNRGTHVGTMDHAAHRDMGQSALGKLPGSVWTIPTEPLTVPDHLGVDHFAAFPTEWPKRIIAGWSPAGVCCACGEGRRPVVDKELRPYQNRTRLNSASGYQKRTDLDADGKPHSSGHNSTGYPMGESVATITGYACACPEPTAPTTPAVVLDPFGGTGTTAMVAKALGRHGITVDMSQDYSRLAQWRTGDRNQLAKVLGIEKVAEPDPAQLDLFGEATA